MNIIEAIKDEALFRPYLGDSISSWTPWLTALRATYGEPIESTNGRKLLEQCTGRQAEHLPQDGFDTALFLTGRRSGKSRVAAIIGAYEAVLAGHESKLSRGEKGIVAVCSPTKYQSRIVTSYLRALFETPMLANEVVNETREGFELRSGTRIEILAGDWRSIRGYTLLAAIIDEACFFGYDLESKVRSDTELVRAVKPSLATVGGKLICISSPYARKGWCYQQWKKHFHNDQSNVLVWNCPSTTMNPTLPQSVVDEAIAEDFQAAKSEYLGEFRDDVALFLPREVIEQSVTRFAIRRPASFLLRVGLGGGLVVGRRHELAKLPHRHFVHAQIKRFEDRAGMPWKFRRKCVVVIGHCSHRKFARRDQGELHAQRVLKRGNIGRVNQRGCWRFGFGRLRGRGLIGSDVRTTLFVSSTFSG